MNPFKYGQIVKGENFCSRPNLEKKLIEHISNNQNIVIEGERRTGKSSLILHVSEKIPDRKLIMIDLFQIKSDFDLQKRILNGITTAKIDGIFDKIISAITHLKPQIGFDPLSNLPTFNLSPGEKVQPETLEGLFSVLNEQSEKRKLLVVFDEFQDIMNLPDFSQTAAIMRAKIQYHDKISYIFSGSVRKKMESIFSHPDSPFFKSASKLTVGPIEDKIFSNFLTKKFKNGDRTVTEKFISEVMNIANFVPGDIQELCSAIWSVSSAGCKIDISIISIALQEIFASERPAYETHIQFLTSLQLQCLVGIAKRGGGNIFSAEFLKSVGANNAASVKKSVNKMVKEGLLYFHEGKYKFSSPFFRQWLVEKNF